jgi:hypothetical protein
MRIIEEDREYRTDEQGISNDEGLGRIVII